jgi:lipopolysaccharide transport system ATP-binding protein
MTSIYARDVVIDFPIYEPKSRSLKNAIMYAATGGVIGKDAMDRVVVRAIDKISFEFHEGDRVGLIGNNGSGKSTLLRVMAGTYEPVSGFLEVNGRVTSMISITMGMDINATGIDNVYLRGYVMGMGKKQIKELVDDVVEFSGLGDYMHLPMRTYSSGMFMRLAFAIATHADADIILMDEWLSAGDAEFVDKAKARLDRIVNTAKIVVLASHNHALIQSQCNKVIRLDKGRIIPNE